MNTFSDAEADNWHGMDPTRRGRGATKKSTLYLSCLFTQLCLGSLQGKLNKRHNSLGCPKRNTSAERSVRLSQSKILNFG